MKPLAEFVKKRRKEVGLTQEEFADRAGVALTVVRKIEQGKTKLNMEKVNLVLAMFGHELGVQEKQKFMPATFQAVLGNLYDRGLIDREELDVLLEEYFNGDKFNSKQLLKDQRPVMIKNEIKQMMTRNNLSDPSHPNYLKA